MRRPKSPNGAGHKWILEHAGYQSEECLIWPFSSTSPGYGQFNIGPAARYMAHRFMCELVSGPPPSDAHQAAHSCGNRRCVNPQHISWKTPSENQLDRTGHGTQNYRGIRGKLTALQAMQIRQLKGTEKAVETAARYGVTESNVRLIQDGVTWKTERKIRHPFTDDQVRAIRKLKGMKRAGEVARQYGVSESSIRMLMAGMSYKFVS